MIIFDHGMRLVTYRAKIKIGNGDEIEFEGPKDWVEKMLNNLGPYHAYCITSLQEVLDNETKK